MDTGDSSSDFGSLFKIDDEAEPSLLFAGLLAAAGLGAAGATYVWITLVFH
jgi:hypothetical protein